MTIQPIPSKINFPVSVRVSRWNSSGGENTIAIEIRDESSRINIAEIELTPEQFALAITGLSVDSLPCESYLNDPRLGKKLIVENKQVTVDYLGTDTRVYRQFLDDNCSEPDKFIVWNATSRHARTYSPTESGKVILNYSLHSYEGINGCSSIFGPE